MKIRIRTSHILLPHKLVMSRLFHFDSKLDENKAKADSDNAVAMRLLRQMLMRPTRLIRPMKPMKPRMPIKPRPSRLTRPTRPTRLTRPMKLTMRPRPTELILMRLMPMWSTRPMPKLPTRPRPE